MATVVASLAVASNTPMGGHFRMVGEQVRPKFTQVLAQKVSSFIECHMLCYQHIQQCLSVWIEETKDSKGQIYTCVLYDKRRYPRNQVNDFEPVTSNKTSIYYILKNDAFKLSCQEYQKAGYSQSGQYWVNLEGKLTKITCSMDGHGGHGWIVIQRRTEESNLNFERNWDSYKNGFSSEKNFWLGNERLHRLTKNHPSSQIEILLEAEIVLPEGNTKEAWGIYGNFSIASEVESYRLNPNLYLKSGDGDFELNAGKKFTTSDRDNDGKGNGNCADINGGGWWYVRCSRVFLNSNDMRTKNRWLHVADNGSPFKRTKMMIRYL